MRSAALALVFLLGCGPYQAARDPADATDGGQAGADGGLASRCTSTAETIHCAHHTLVVSPGGLGLGNRDVHWQVPLGPPPTGGWPVVMMFQGSFLSADGCWDSVASAPYGGFHQAQVARRLLDSGFAVLTPKTRFNGSYYWDTNVVGFSEAWGTSDDHHLMLAIFDGLAAGRFGPVDPSRLYATGISSGGYMTSRMALSYPGKFRALAVVSASWATCASSLCSVPSPLPSDHPPTLFLHGALDSTVPISTMQPYAEGLTAQKTPVRVITDPNAGHAWLDVAPAEVTGWFKKY